MNASPIVTASYPLDQNLLDSKYMIDDDTDGVPELIDDEPMTEAIRSETMQELVFGKGQNAY